jgi:hypothetical protein
MLSFTKSWLLEKFVGALRPFVHICSLRWLHSCYVQLKDSILTIWSAWGPFLTFPLGANLAPVSKLSPGVNFVPWGWSYPLGVKFSVRPSILLNSM